MNEISVCSIEVSTTKVERKCSIEVSTTKVERKYHASFALGLV